MTAAETDFDVAAQIAHVKPLVGMREKAAPRHTALVVIDMQNDFIAKEGLIAREGRDVSQAVAMAEELPKLLRSAREAGVFVVFVRNVYTTDNNFYLSDVWLEQAARRRQGGYTRDSGLRGEFVVRRLLRRGSASARRAHRHEASLQRLLQLRS